MANRYWVGGTATWDGTAGTKWATTSGGAGGAAAPSFGNDDVFFDAASGAVTVTMSVCSALSVNFTGFTGTITGTGTLNCAGSVTLGSGMTNSYTGTFALSGTSVFTSNGKAIDSPITFSGTSLTLGDNLVNGATRTVTLTGGALDLNEFSLSTGLFASTGSTARSIDFTNATMDLTGTGAITVWDTTNATNFSITGQSTGTIVVSGSTASTRTIVMDSSPLVLGPNLSITGGSGQITMTNVTCHNFSSGAGYTGALSSGLGVYNDFDLHANAADSTALTLTMRATSGTKTINLNGNAVNNLVINGVGGTFSLTGNMVASNAITVTNGTFNTQTYSITTSVFQSNNSNTRVINLGSSVITLPSSVPTIWDFTSTTGLTFNAGTSVITVTNSSTTNKTFIGGGQTFAGFHNASGNTGTVIITGSNTFSDMTINAGRTQHFTAGTTTTITNSFTATGASGNTITIGSPTAAQHTLDFDGVGDVSCDWLLLSYSNGTPATTWYAGANSTDNGNNTGWTFTVPPAITDVKTVNGIARANVKTWNAAAIATVKSINGIE